MTTVTDWSKFQRNQLFTLLTIQDEVGTGTVSSLELSIKALKAQMEKEDIARVLEERK